MRHRTVIGVRERPVPARRRAEGAVSSERPRPHQEVYALWSGSLSSIQIALTPYRPYPSYQWRVTASIAAGLVASTSALPVGVA